jgi:hypothetical protein
MINIKSIGCGLAFAPYILESLNSYVESGRVMPQVVKQAASGLILRSEEDLIIHYQNREVSLNQDEARHYLETVKFRQVVFEICRTSGEVVLANIARALLLSHPQSEIWLERSEIPYLIAAFQGSRDETIDVLPEWLTISGGDGKLVLSDGRNGRWVLLGQDHLLELERRLPLMGLALANESLKKPPTIQMKGLNIHLQSAFKLLSTFEEFSLNGDFLPYEEYTPTYSLRVLRTIEGMKITDGNLLISVLAKEARKWTAIVESELEKLNAVEAERGNLKTVFASDTTGFWILQSGDEICLSNEQKQTLIKHPNSQLTTSRLIAKTEGEFSLILDQVTGACVALNSEEIEKLQDY